MYGKKNYVMTLVLLADFMLNECISCERKINEALTKSNVNYLKKLY